MPLHLLSKQTAEMKTMKGRLLKKLKLHPTVTAPKQGVHSAGKFLQEDHKRLSDYIPSLKHEEQAEVDNIICSTESKTNVPAMDVSEALDYPSLSDFEEKCPPEGSEAVILYTTSLRGIRKTFEDCQSIRFLLQSFRLTFYERDVSMHLEFREELWRILGGRVIPPSLFIKGRYIGGADEVVGLHEQGKLKKLLQGIPVSQSFCPCAGCGNLRFVVCSNCNGSRKVFTDGENGEMYIRCTTCNENGLVKCSICS